MHVGSYRKRVPLALRMACSMREIRMSAFAESARTAVELIVHADPVLLHTVGAVAGGQRQRPACWRRASGWRSGAWLAVARFPGHRALVAAAEHAAGAAVGGGRPGGLPAAVALAGRSARWASCSRRRRWSIAQTILVLPLIAALTRQLVGDALRDGGDQLRSMGAGRWPARC